MWCAKSTSIVSATIPAIDFSAKEYSEEDKDGTEHTDWKRTYHMLLKGSPALQEIYCDMSADVQWGAAL